MVLCSSVSIVTRAAFLASVKLILGCRQLGNICVHPHYCSVCVNVWAPMALSECAPEVLCNWDGADRTAMLSFFLSPFNCLSVSNLQRVWIENVHWILDFPIHIQIWSFICWKLRLCLRGLKRGSPLSYAQHPAYVNLNDNIDFLSMFLLTIPPKALRVRADNLGNRD